MTNKIIPAFLIAICMLLNACSKNETLTFSIDAAQLKGEGPLFEGANTAQCNVKDALSAFIKEKELDMNKIQSIKLNSVTLSMPDSLNFDIYTSLILQFASEKTDMFKAAVINPVPQGKSSVTMTVAQEQESLLDLLKQDNFTMVADVNVAKDTAMDILMNANLNFTIDYKK
ncbi:MAG: hypothetical protein V4613_09295 [Bacteroidota bacterium]